MRKETSEFGVRTTVYLQRSFYAFLIAAINSYVFLYGYDAARDDIGNDGEASSSRETTVQNSESESGDSSSSEVDSLLAGLDSRAEDGDSNIEDDNDNDDSDATDNDSDDQHESIRKKQTGTRRKTGAKEGGNGRGRHAEEGDTPTKTPPGAGADISRRKTMFAEMKRESMAGTLQQVGAKKLHRRASSGDSDEDLEKLEALVSEGEDDASQHDDSDGVDLDGGKNWRSTRSSSGSRAGGRAMGTARERHEDNDDGAGVPDDGGDEGSDSDVDSEISVSSDDEGGMGGGVGAEPRFLIYFWAGTRAKKSDWVLWKLELAKTMIPEWQKVGAFF